MDLRDTYLATPNVGFSHSVSDPMFAPIGLLHAHHFVSAFREGNKGQLDTSDDHRGNIYKHDLESVDRFWSHDSSMAWATPWMHLDSDFAQFLTKNRPIAAIANPVP